MTGPTPGGGTIGARQLEQLMSRLSDRDRAILVDLARVRLLTGLQLTRLHFSSLSTSTRDRLRRRVMARLAGLGLVTTLERQIGGVHAGSAGLVYALTAAGQRAVALAVAESGLNLPTRARAPWSPGLAFLKHTLTVSELYVRLVEAQRAGTLAVGEFLAEPAAWFSNGMGGVLKPDAYAVLRLRSVEDSWAIEVDKATESLATLRRKLLAYVDFAHAGQVGPDGVTPRVLVTVPHQARLKAVHGLVADLPEPGEQLVSVVLESKAVIFMGEVLRE